MIGSESEKDLNWTTPKTESKKKVLQVHFREHNITFIDFIPKIGTLSLPVKNAVNANRR